MIMTFQTLVYRCFEPLLQSDVAFFLSFHYLSPLHSFVLLILEVPDIMMRTTGLKTFFVIAQLEGAFFSILC